MSDSSDETVRLRLGFDTNDITNGGNVYVLTAARIQQAAQDAANAHRDSWAQMSMDQKKALVEQQLERQKAEAQYRQQQAARLEAQRQADDALARQARLASGVLAKEYVLGLQTQFKLAQAQIGAAVGAGLMNAKDAKAAAQANALAYNSQLRLAIEEPGGLFQGIGAANQTKATAEAVASFKTISVASEAAGLGLGRLRYSFVSLASQMTNLPPIVGRVVGAFGGMALGVAPLLALLAVIIGMAEAWKVVQAPLTTANKLTAEHSESARHANDNMVLLNAKLKDYGALKLDGPTTELIKLNKEIEDTQKMFSGADSIRGYLERVRLMWREAVEVAAGGGDKLNQTQLDHLRVMEKQLKDGVITQQAYVKELAKMQVDAGGTGVTTLNGPMAFNASVEKLNDSLRAGSITAVQYRNALLELVDANKGNADLAAPWLKLAGALQGLQDAQGQARAQADQLNATQREQTRLYGSPALAKGAQDLFNLGAQYRAVASGGKDALKATQDQQKTQAAATEEWNKYVTSVEGSKQKFGDRYLSEFTYLEAVRAGVSQVAQFRSQQEQLTAAEVKLSKATEASNKAAEERKRIQTETKERTRSADTAALEAATELESLKQLSDAALQGNAAYQKLDAQLKVDAEVRRSDTALTKEFTDAASGQLLITEKALEQRKNDAERIIRQTEAEKALTAARVANNTTDASIRSQLALADAWERGAISAKNEAIEVKYLTEMQKAGAIVDDGERARAERLAGDERYAAQRLQQAQESSKERDAAQKEELRANEAALKQEGQQYKTFVEDTQRVVTGFFENILSGGTNTFGKLVDTIKQLFVKLLADLAAMKIGQFFVQKALEPTIMGLSADVFSPEMQARVPGGGSAPTGALASGLGYGGVALSAGLIGYGVGGMVNGYGQAGLAGSAAGAATGAAIGSVVPLVGTAVGAVVGSLVGLVGGLLGQASKIKKAREEFYKAEDEFATALTPQTTAVAKQFHDIEQTFKNLQDAAQKLGKSVEQNVIDLKTSAEAALRADFATSLTTQLNALDGVQGDYRNQLAAIEKAYHENLDTAEALGGNETDLWNVEKLRTAQLDQLNTAMEKTIAAQAASNKRDEDSLRLRQLQAKGDTDAAHALQERMELEDAAAAGKSAEYLALLKTTQAIEDETAARQKETQAAKDAAAAAESLTQKWAGLSARFATASGNAAGGSDIQFAEQQRQEMYAAKQDPTATPEFIASLAVVQLLERGQRTAQQTADKQTQLMESQLQVAQGQLQIASQTLNDTKQARASVNAFKDSIALNGSLTTLSPLDQRTEALRQLQDLYDKAKGGDTKAASDFGASANNFLQISREDYASSPAYVADYKMVQDMANSLETQLGAQETVEQKIVDALNAQIELLNTQIALLKDSNNLQKAASDAVVNELREQAKTSIGAGTAEMAQLVTLMTQLTGTAREIVQAEYDNLAGNNAAVEAATEAEVNAIRNGASLQQLATLEQIRQLTLQKAAMDNMFAQQLAIAIQTYGAESSQVAAILAMQKTFDSGIQAQINALNGLPGEIANAISKLLAKGPPTGPPVLDPGGGGGSKLPLNPSGTNTTGQTLYAVHDPYMNIDFNLPAGGTVTDIQGNYYDGSIWHPRPSPVDTGGSGGSNGEIQGFASGGTFGGGIRLVGEDGPELEVTGPSQILNAQLTERLLAAGSGGGVVDTLTALVQRQDATIAVLQAGLSRLLDAQETTAAKIDDNTTVTKRGFETARSR